MQVVRTVDYKTQLFGGAFNGHVLVISAINEPLKLDTARAILNPHQPMLSDLLWDGQLPDRPREDIPPSGMARGMAMKFLEPDPRLYLETEVQRLSDFLMGPEAVVPVFGSPPSGWIPLRTVMAHAAGVFAAWGNSGDIPTALLSYVGMVVLVRFVDPVAQSAGSALADGVGAAIRKAFGLSETPQIGQGIAPEDDSGEGM
ncbi:hypothetical protein ABZ484_11215 [Streptomyces sp. NPDC006393]|uniref:hypothetical protein n=1 Tax=Streptomyces sp. NPDC006393 TaxID=3156763 RepID=UPI0034097001